MLQIVLKDASGLIQSVGTGLNGISSILNDPSILQIVDPRQLAMYMITHHYRTTINDVDYYHSNCNMDCNGNMCFTFTML